MVKSIWFLTAAYFLFYFSVLKAEGQTNRDIEEFEETGGTWVSKNEIIPVGSSSFNIYDIIEGKADSLFEPLILHSQLKKDSTYWIRFSIGTNSLLNQWILQMKTRFKTVELYFIDNDGKIKTLSSGTSKKYSSWPVSNFDISFSLPNNLVNNQYFMKVHIEYSVGFGLDNSSYKNFITETNKRNFSYGIFYGIVLISMIFSLLFYFKLKERTYLFYSLYVFCFAIFATVDWGIILVPLSYVNIPWHRDLYTVPFSSMTIFLLLYSRGLLELRKKELILDKMVMTAVYVRIVIYFIGTIFNIHNLYSPSIDNLLLLTAFVSAIVKLKKGYKPARYFLVGLSILYLGLIVHSLENIGLISYNVLPLFSMYKTGVMEMFFFSLALADRFRVMKKDQELAHRKTIDYLRENSRLQEEMIIQLNENEALKDKLNLELEAKVLERTKALEEANNVILEINRFLEESNRNLATEVRKISVNRVMQKTVTFDEFKEIYPDEDSCYSFLEKLKWSGGFKCKKCGYHKYSAGTTPYSRRCSRCNYIERITSETIFVHTKFAITKAFYLLFLVNSGKNLTIDSLAEILDLRKQTVWFFKKKIMEIMQANPRKKGNLNEGWSRWILYSMNGKENLKNIN